MYHLFIYLNIVLFFVSIQVSLVAEERDHNISRVQELEAAIIELKSAAGKTFGWLFVAFLHFLSPRGYPGHLNATVLFHICCVFIAMHY